MSESNTHIFRLITNSRDKFRALVDGIGDEIMSVGNDLRITAVNKALAEAKGCHPRDVIGEKCHLALYGFERPCPEYDLPCPVFLSRESLQPEIVLHDLPGPEDGEPDQVGRYIEIRSMPLLDSSDNILEFIVDRRDITIQKLAETRIREHNDRLEREVARRTREIQEANEILTCQKEELLQANQELLALQNLKEDLTNMVVHDLKGPLSEIQANLELLKTQPMTPLEDEFVEAAKMGGSELLRMITNLLDISRLEENRLVLDPELIDVAALIESARDRYAPMARLNNIRLRMDFPENLPPLRADRRLMERIFNNLISNALDFTPESGAITILADCENPAYRFEVKDTGPGIPPELHERIFEKFHQGCTSSSRTSSGLGLTFCRMAVEAHGGRIWVESEPERGSNFVFLIPNSDEPDCEPEAWS